VRVEHAGAGAGGAGEGGEGEAIQGEAAEPVVRKADPVRGSPGQCRQAAAVQGPFHQGTRGKRAPAYIASLASFITARIARVYIRLVALLSSPHYSN